MRGERSDSAPGAADNLVRISDMPVFAASRFPVWVFDIDAGQIVWANPAALSLWQSPDLDELNSRSLGDTMSDTVSLRLRQYQSAFWSGQCFDESWTILPKDTPATLLCRFRGCVLEDGRMGLLVEAQKAADQPAELVRGAHALLYTGAMISTYAINGSCIYANPAARQAFAEDRLDLGDRVMSATVLERLLAYFEAPFTERLIAPVRTREGLRIHEIEACESYDSISANRTLLLTEFDVTEKENSKRQITHLVNHDQLTGLNNRAYLSQKADAFIAKAHERGESAFLYLLDLDRFKYINDSHGHVAGDDILIETATRLKLSMPRESIVCRIGGDEFCALHSDVKPLDAATRLSRRLLDTLAQPVRASGIEIRSTASLGIAVARPSETRPRFEDLLTQADLALYDAKGKGGNRSSVFRRQLAVRSRRFNELETELTNALRDGRYELYFQPKVSLATNTPVGGEALIRLHLADGRTLSPQEFIPVAEATGLIGQLGRWVLDEALRCQMDLAAAGLQRTKICVNISPRQFSDPGLLPQLRSYLGRPGFDPALFELEITETDMQMDDRRFMKLLRMISEMGYPLAVDDFGTAYSNIARLRQQPIDCIKIDRSLVGDPKNRLLTKAVINIARSLDARVVAEGVETEDQRDWLSCNGCEEYQGFLYSAPVPLGEYKRILQTA